jgi:tetratricopeptide (TPR) repeat protein
MALGEALYRMQRNEFSQAETLAVAAARADALSPDPWRVIAELRLARWQQSGREADWESFVAAADAFAQLDPRHHQAWQTRGIWYLTAWRKSGRKESLTEAISAFTRASMCYPNRAFYHAQLAWALHLAGQRDAAVQAAERALELDGLMPHKEQKLDRQHVADPQISGKEARLFREESAEQTARRLRTASAEEK